MHVIGHDYPCQGSNPFFLLASIDFSRRCLRESTLMEKRFAVRCDRGDDVVRSQLGVATGDETWTSHGKSIAFSSLPASRILPEWDVGISRFGGCERWPVFVWEAAEQAPLYQIPTKSKGSAKFITTYRCDGIVARTQKYRGAQLRSTKSDSPEVRRAELARLRYVVGIWTKSSGASSALRKARQLVVEPSLLGFDTSSVFGARPALQVRRSNTHGEMEFDLCGQWSGG